MPIDPPFNVYRDQLSYLSFGLPLWNPPNPVAIGDVGYLHEGTFVCTFNVMLPWDHPSNGKLGKLEPYKSLDCGPFINTLERHFAREEHYSCRVFASTETNDSMQIHDNVEVITYNCRRGHGALLFLPKGGRSADIIRKKLFEAYIRDNVDSLFRWSKKKGLPVDRMEDLILVTGYTLAKSWAVAVFDGTTSRDKDATTISLETRKSDGGGVQFVWHNMRGSVVHNHRDSNIEGPENQCVYIRGLRAKRILYWTKPLRALSDYPRNRREDDSRSNLDTNGSPINHKNPQLRPYPSSTGSTAPQSNGDLCNASLFMTSPSEYSYIEVRNDTVETRQGDTLAEDTYYNHERLSRWIVSTECLGTVPLDVGYAELDGTEREVRTGISTGADAETIDMDTLLGW